MQEGKKCGGKDTGVKGWWSEDGKVEITSKVTTEISGVDWVEYVPVELSSWCASESSGSLSGWVRTGFSSPENQGGLAAAEKVLADGGSRT